MRAETIAVHGGYSGDPTTKAVAVPIYQTVAYEFDNADHAAALFNLEAEGYRYSRIANPTNAVLESRLAELEGGVGALSTSTGQAALYCAFANVADHGGTIVAAPTLYGTTHTLLAHVLPRQGVRVRFARSEKPQDIAEAMDESTRAVFCESVANPAGNVCDVEALAKVAHSHGVPLIIDNTVATPVLLRPIEYGADIVVHSMTKCLGGHGTTLGGIIVDSGRFPWKNYPTQFPMFSEADPSYHGLVYTDQFGNSAYIARARTVYQRTIGAVLAPFSAFLLLQGVETVALRVERQTENARKVAEFLRADSRVAWVNYHGFPDSAYYSLVKKYLTGRAPPMISFGPKGGLPGGKAFYDALRLIKRLVNIGDAKTLACHPASTTHRQMSAVEQGKAGVTPDMIRLSIGIEHVDDIIGDIDHALSCATSRLPRQLPNVRQTVHLATVA
jgi:O-acetylhomoserine (thiol)-lyase